MNTRHALHFMSSFFSAADSGGKELTSSEKRSCWSTTVNSNFGCAQYWDFVATRFAALCVVYCCTTFRHATRSIHQECPAHCMSCRMPERPGYTVQLRTKRRNNYVAHESEPSSFHTRHSMDTHSTNRGSRTLSLFSEQAQTRFKFGEDDGHF